MYSIVWLKGPMHKIKATLH